MDWLPLFLQLRGQSCLLVGGGEVALRKARLLADHKMVLHVIAPEIHPELATLASASGGTLARRPYASEDIQTLAPQLVIAATGEPSVNQLVAEVATASRVLVNVVDQPALCTAIFPSIVDRSPLVLALSSGGGAPVLLRQWREKLEALLPASLGGLVRFAASQRQRVRELIDDKTARRRFWERFFGGSAAESILAGRAAEGEHLFAKLLQAPEAAQGEVYLVGAGPGDPDLLTLRALQLMQKADLVLYDNLVSKTVLERCRRDAERIYVGKKRAYKALRQEEITQLMITHAQDGKRVLRLKGGDPFVFGRGGEEIAGLAEQQIPFQVVPGITAANGCAAYAGIPLTHRDYAQSVRFITGHLKRDEMNLEWPELARPGQTLVFYMGRKNLPYLTAALLKHGLAPDTPVALVENGTLPEQRVFVERLDQVEPNLAQKNLKGPTVAIIGQVVRLREQIGRGMERGG